MLRDGRLLNTRAGWFAERAWTRIGVDLLKIRKRLKYAPDRGALPVSHVTIYAAGNAGDTVLSECVRRTFDRAFDNDINWKLRYLFDPVDDAAVGSINASGFLLIGGGGVFLPDTNENAVSGWEWACGREQLGAIQVPIVLYSVGYNYFRGQQPNELFIENLNAIVERSAFVGLRNHGSVETVRALLSEPLRDKVCYQPCTTTLIRKLLPELPPKRETGKVAFNFAFDRAERRYGGYQPEIIDQLVRSMHRLRDKGYEIYIVAHCLPDLSMRGAVGDWKGIHAVNASMWDLDKLARFYNQMDVVLGMRGHAQMIPFGVNCQIISLGSHEKMRWFLEDIDAQDWYVELTEDIPTLSDRVVTKFEEIHERGGAETTRRLLRAQDRLLEITEANMRSIKATVENR